MSRSPGTPDARLSTSPGSSYHTMAGIRNSGRLRGMVRRRAGRIYLAISVWALSPSLAHAALVYDTSPVSFNNNLSVTDKEKGASANDNNASLGTSELDQFDASLGVLTGVTIGAHQLNKKKAAQTDEQSESEPDGENSEEHHEN